MMWGKTVKNKTEALKCIQKLTKFLQTQIRLYILPQQTFFQPIKTNMLDFCMHSIFFCFVVFFAVFADETTAIKEDRRVSKLYKLIVFKNDFFFAALGDVLELFTLDKTPAE